MTSHIDALSFSGSSLPNIGILGGDMRQVYLIQELQNYGFPVLVYGLNHFSIPDTIYCTSLQEFMDRCSVIMGPIPFSKDGVYLNSMTSDSSLTINEFTAVLKPHHTIIAGKLPKAVENVCNHNQISYYDWMRSESIALLNAVATAEGSIMEAISFSPYNLHQNPCLVLGFGRCAQILSERLSGLKGSVTIAARSRDARLAATAHGYSSLELTQLEDNISNYLFIFNTIPALILTEPILKKVPEDCVIIDIASAPGGIDYAAAERLKRKARFCPGIPGKVSPKSSALILAQETLPILKKKNK